MNTGSKFDTRYSLENLEVLKIFKEILARKHFVGIHPGYNSSSNQEIFNNSILLYKNLLKRFSQSTQIHSRQHYLKFNLKDTIELWEQNKINSDSSMGYSNAVGFRSGICHDYSLFNFKSMSKINIREFPLIVMECAIFNDSIYDDFKIKKIKNLIDTCKIYDGCFTLLWHNSYFSNKRSKKYYESILGMIE